MAKQELGLPLTDEDYANIETKETKLREVTNMQNYVNNAAESYGRDSGAMMDEMLKLNGCNSVDELQAKVARGESILEASDTAWNAGIQKEHYAAYDAKIAAERTQLDLNSSLRQAELGTHGAANAIYAQQNIQGGQINSQIPTWVKHTVDFCMTASLAASEAFPIIFNGPISQPIRGGAIIDLVTHTGIDTLNYLAGNGDGVTLLANASSNVVSTLAGVATTAATAHAIGLGFGTAGSALGPAGTLAAYTAGFVAGAVVTEMGLNEPIEQWLRDPLKKKKQMQWEELRKSNTWTGVRG